MIFVLLPAYNEEEAIVRLVPKIDSALREEMDSYQIVLLDDGSTDRTLALAKELCQQYPITIIEHQGNLGLGTTLKDGLTYIAQHAVSGDLVVSLDCDDTHEPRYVRPALEKARMGYDLVILSRFEKGGREEGLSFIRKILSRGACLLLQLFFPIRGVRDYSCGFRVYRARALKEASEIFGDRFIRLTNLGFVAAAEIVIKLRMTGARMVEVPFTLHYDQKKGRSKNNAIKTIVGYLALVMLYFGRRVSREVKIQHG